MDVTTEIGECSQRSPSDLEPGIARSNLDLSAMGDEDDMSVENTLNEAYLDEEQCLETEQSVQALLEQERGNEILH